MERKITHTTRHMIQHGLETCILLIEMTYCIGLFVGILLGLTAIVWMAAGWLGMLPVAQEGLQLPWDGKGWSLVVIYSAFVWFVYILPGWQESRAQSHVKLSQGRVQRTVLMHAAIWCGVFGPVAMLAGWYTGLSWQMGAVFSIALVWGFYEEVWKVLSRLQYDPKTLSLIAKLRHRVPSRGHSH
jgi:hypothetical protein